MTNTSISQLKKNPSAVLEEAADYPVAVTNKSKVKGYIIGKDLFEALASKLEDAVDLEEAKNADYDDSVDFEEFVKDLNV